jgi:molybdopterin converting factor small subunit
MVNVVLWGALKPAAGGASSLAVEARDIRELFGRLEEAYPGLKPHLDRGIAVSINGRIFRDSWGEPIPADAEVYLLPRIAGG